MVCGVWCAKRKWWVDTQAHLPTATKNYAVCCPHKRTALPSQPLKCKKGQPDSGTACLITVTTQPGMLPHTHWWLGHAWPWAGAPPAGQGRQARPQGKGKGHPVLHCVWASLEQKRLVALLLPVGVGKGNAQRGKHTTAHTQLVVVVFSLFLEHKEKRFPDGWAAPAGSAIAGQPVAWDSPVRVRGTPAPNKKLV